MCKITLRWQGGKVVWEIWIVKEDEEGLLLHQKARDNFFWVMKQQRSSFEHKEGDCKIKNKWLRNLSINEPLKHEEPRKYKTSTWKGKIGGACKCVLQCAVDVTGNLLVLHWYWYVYLNSMLNMMASLDGYVIVKYISRWEILALVLEPVSTLEVVWFMVIYKTSLHYVTIISL